MSSAIDRALADAVKTDLAAATWTSAPSGVTYEAGWLPDWDENRELTNPELFVSPDPAPAFEAGERHAQLEQWTILVALASALTARTDAELDGMCSFLDEILAFLQRREITFDSEQFTPFAANYRIRFEPSLLARQKRPDGKILYVGTYFGMLAVTYFRNTT